ncbi:MAG TPA: hypothetical protein ENJ08_04990 [Gammaproteobacteria bacterium]|nr:hypothetical protein [Gammaproteobacteria bacterium]
MFILLKKIKSLLVLLTISMLSIASNAYSMEGEQYLSDKTLDKCAVIKAEMYAAKGSIKKQPGKIIIKDSNIA